MRRRRDASGAASGATVDRPVSTAAQRAAIKLSRPSFTELHASARSSNFVLVFFPPQPQSVDLFHSANRHICVTKSRILFSFLHDPRPK
jgi:hypothetical protein